MSALFFCFFFTSRQMNAGYSNLRAIKCFPSSRLLSAANLRSRPCFLCTRLESSCLCGAEGLHNRRMLETGWTMRMMIIGDNDFKNPF